METVPAGTVITMNGKVIGRLVSDVKIQVTSVPCAIRLKASPDPMSMTAEIPRIAPGGECLSGADVRFMRAAGISPFTAKPEPKSI